METRKRLVGALAVALMVIASNCANAGEAFQGLSWGSTVQQIKRQFPQATQSQPDTTQYPICKSANGAPRHCTVSEATCADIGYGCTPPLKIDKYMVGTYPFNLNFALSKQGTLSRVELGFAGGAEGNSEQYGIRIYDHIASSLENRYGPPSEISEYQKDWREGLIGAGMIWKTKDTKINLNYSAALDLSNGSLKHVTLSVIYSPLLDEFSSRL